jgi:hypothetical protein
MKHGNKQKFLRGAGWALGDTGVTKWSVVDRGTMQGVETFEHQKMRIRKWSSG